MMIISHADNDHSGGAPAIRRLLNVDDELGALTPAACHDGQRWDWDGVRFEMLHPDAAHYSSNNSGCVLRIEAGSYAALLPADIEKTAERHLLLRAEVSRDKYQTCLTTEFRFLQAFKKARVELNLGRQLLIHCWFTSLVQRLPESA